jgi:alpha-tubulin suppressor-like RCC1 family protein
MLRRLRLTCVLALVGCPNGEDSDPETDSETDTDTETDTDSETPVNTAPTVTAGPGTHALVGDLVWLTATGEDADGDALTYTFLQTAGPMTDIFLSEPNVGQLRPRAVGRYTFEITASDGEAQSNTATIDVVVHDLAAGNAYTAYLSPDGALSTWGVGPAVGAGELPQARLAPGPVCDVGATDCAADPLTGVVALSGGAAHVLARTAAGNVLAWGQSSDGQVGDGTFDNRSTPVPVCDLGAVDCANDPLEGVVAVAAGYWFSLALMMDGTVRAWGRASNGELGNGSAENAVTPVPVCSPEGTGGCGNAFGRVAHIRAGGAGHALALDLDGQLWGWGHNKRGQTGNGDASQREVFLPEPVCAPGSTSPCTSYLEGVADMDPWSGNSFAVMEDGTLYGWGGGNDGELGPLPETLCNGELCAPFPTEICTTTNTPCDAWLPAVRDVVAGRRFSLALLTDGTVVGWGENSEGQLGIGHRSSPIVVATPVCAPTPGVRGGGDPCTGPLTDVLWIAGGDYHAFAYTADGTLYSWGDNATGQLGNGDDEPAYSLPTEVEF